MTVAYRRLAAGFGEESAFGSSAVEYVSEGTVNRLLLRYRAEHGRTSAR